MRLVLKTDYVADLNELLRVASSSDARLIGVDGVEDALKSCADLAVGVRDALPPPELLIKMMEMASYGLQISMVDDPLEDALDAWISSNRVN